MTRLLAEATTAEAVGSRLVLVPVGSLEQHGPHLPLDTDTEVAVAVASGVAERLSDAGAEAWVAPPISYGASGEHQSFAGTSSIGTESLRLLLVELVRSVRSWAERVVLVNGHGGNLDALRSAVGQLVAEGHDVCWAACTTESVDLHAGRTETSLMLHLRPRSVRLDLVVAGDTRPLAEILPHLKAGGVASVSANGVLGGPSDASASEGAAVLAAMVDHVLATTMAGIR